MDLLRRAFAEHRVAVVVIGVVELAVLLIVVSILSGHVIVPFGAIIGGLLVLLLWRRRKRESAKEPPAL